MINEPDPPLTIQSLQEIKIQVR